MKKVLILLIACFLILEVNAQNKKDKAYPFIGIIQTPPNTAYNFNSFDIIDNYGYRAHIPLGDQKLSQQNWGFNLGASVPMIKHLNFLADMQFSFGKAFNFLFLLGPAFNIVESNIFTFGPTVKAGFAYTYIGLGEVTTNGSYVLMGNGKIFDGDKMHANLYGVCYQLGVFGSCRLNKKISLFSQFGLGGAYLGLMDIRITPYEGEPFNIDVSRNDCVEPNSQTPISFTPKVKSYGYYYNLGVAFGL